MGHGSRTRRLSTVLVVATMVVGLAGIVEVGAQPVPYADTPVGGWAVNGRVMATEIIGNTVYVGGTFTSVSGPGGSVARQNLAAFDSRTGALRTGFVANANQAVRALDTNGTSLFVGGSFSSIAGVTRQRRFAQPHQRCRQRWVHRQRQRLRQCVEGVGQPALRRRDVLHARRTQHQPGGRCQPGERRSNHLLRSTPQRHGPRAGNHARRLPGVRRRGVHFDRRGGSALHRRCDAQRRPPAPATDRW